MEGRTEENRAVPLDDEQQAAEAGLVSDDQKAANEELEKRIVDDRLAKMARTSSTQKAIQSGYEAVREAAKAAREIDRAQMEKIEEPPKRSWWQRFWGQ